MACMQAVLTYGGALLAAQAPTPPASPVAVLSTAQVRYDSLFACPTTLDQIGRVVVPVRVDGRGPFRFVVDTGASHSTVSPELVRALGLSVSKIPLIDLEGITGSAAVPAVRIRTLRAGSLVIRDTAVPVLRTSMMAGADGILGIAGIRDITLLVNFQDNQVRISRELSPGVRFDYSRTHTEVVSGGLMAVPAYVGSVRVLAIIDTGSERSLGNPALRAALHLRASPGRLEPVTAVYGATKQIEMGRMITTPIISLGPLRIAGVSLIYGKFHIFKVWHLEDRPAIILGMDVLGTVSALGFDFPRHDLFVSGVRPPLSSFQGNLTDEMPTATEAEKKIH
jgi:hypothetical protein